MRKYLLAVLLFFIAVNTGLSQTNKPVYPQIKGFVSVLHPIATFDKNGHSFNFSHKNGYTVSFPIALLILKSDKIGFAFEVAPVIKADTITAKVTNLVFDPGVIFRLKHGFNFITRVAFETSGRFGFTPVFAKTIIKQQNVSYFVDVAAPVRFGNAKPVSIGSIFQFGVIF